MIVLRNASITIECPRHTSSDETQCYVTWGPFEKLTYGPDHGGALASLDVDPSSHFGIMFIKGDERRPLSHQFHDRSAEGIECSIGGVLEYTEEALAKGISTIDHSQTTTFGA